MKTETKPYVLEDRLRSDEERKYYAQAMQETATQHDWPEEFHHENGCYMNTCVVCKTVFQGHKYRRVCKVCHNNPQPTTQVGSSDGS